MIRPAFLRTFCALLAILITAAAHAKIRPGDEERLLKVAGEIIARQNAFKSMKVQLIEHGEGRLVKATTEWTVWIEGENIAAEKKRVATIPDGTIQQQFARSISTPDFFAAAESMKPGPMIIGAWFEIRDGQGHKRLKTARMMHAPPNPLLDITRLSDKGVIDLQDLLVNSTTIWRIDDKPDAEGLVVLTRATPKGEMLDVFTIDTQRGHYIVEHANYGPTGVQRRRTATLKQFGDVWFPATTTLEYSNGSTQNVTCTDAQFDQPVPPQRFEITSLGCAEGSTLPHYYVDGRREFHVCVQGVFFDLGTARDVLRAIRR